MLPQPVEDHVTLGLATGPPTAVTVTENPCWPPADSTALVGDIETAGGAAGDTVTVAGVEVKLPVEAVAVKW